MKTYGCLPLCFLLQSQRTLERRAGRRAAVAVQGARQRAAHPQIVRRDLWLGKSRLSMRQILTRLVHKALASTTSPCAPSSPPASCRPPSPATLRTLVTPFPVFLNNKLPNQYCRQTCLQPAAASLMSCQSESCRAGPWIASQHNSSRVVKFGSAFGKNTCGSEASLRGLGAAGDSMEPVLRSVELATNLTNNRPGRLLASRLDGEHLRQPTSSRPTPLEALRQV